MSEHAKIRLVSDGCPDGTHVEADGKRLLSTHIVFEIGVDKPATVTVTMYVDEVDIDGVIRVIACKQCRSCDGPLDENAQAADQGKP